MMQSNDARNDSMNIMNNVSLHFSPFFGCRVCRPSVAMRTWPIDAHRPETSQRGRTKLRVEAHARRLQTAYLYLEIEITRCPHDCLKALAALASLASLAVRLDRLVSIKRFAIRIVELPKLTQLVAPKWFCHSLHVRASPATQCYSPISRELCNPNLNR